MHSRFSFITALAICASATFISPKTAGAAFLFIEDFEDYPNVSFDSDGSNQGIPLVSEGAKQTWYGGRFEAHDDGLINDDVVIRHVGGEKYARLEDDAGILFNISTMGISNPILSFKWFTHNTETNDRFVAGYRLGSLDFVNDTADSSPNNMFHNFNADGPAWSGGGWVELLRDTDPTQWNNESFPIPGNQVSVWIAFWLDNGEGDYGKVDDITVTPEPGSLALMGMGTLLLVRLRRSSK